MRRENEKDKLAFARAAMIQEQLKSRNISDSGVLEVMARLPREKFIPSESAEQAYFDCPVPIGCGQTISQPYMVALMTEELRLDKNCTVLEIGTGSGYQTAILAKLAKEICTIERIETLSLKAQKVLAELEIENVKFYIGDGSCGWYEDKKFDRIIITAGAADMPGPLFEQLKLGGFAVAPLGGDFVQQLMLLEKTPKGVKTKSVCGCRFVKLIGKFEYEE
ncbi:MAG: protein-L-isoaspartate(D-aspartate) O-methyltransferase [Phycisphaerae bacterium]|nr:protein-L-isoaspartate(D-aspartate) O-methyltransferase [Phycisphaerae bacterium]